ncbi:carbamoyltransferase HypF [Candidatus Leptofilum sp.]|uniref:carbamoyltransferase HypF n=1 Tax=Candidatus Leptofilum sp. TaxID=3241576 RepID=UPI003B59CA61
MTQQATSATQPAVQTVRQRLKVQGVVQGVGFRPFVYGLAKQHNLTGFVGNNSSGVFIEIEGTTTAVAQFQHALTHNQPPLAHIEQIFVAELPVQNSRNFVITHSQAQAATNTLISPDITLCDDCLSELFDPQNRRHRYPFTNCTNCGPRFTIIKDIPYDRPLTTMAEFAMCADCQAEYDNPQDRRFHAQPNACGMCGPGVWLEESEQYSVNGVQLSVRGEAAIVAVQELLAAGRIVAVKGLGGFHLACDATSDVALATLRERKGRVDKPFAVMARDVATVRQFAHLSEEEEALLTSKERPILLLHQKANNPLSKLVAPSNNTIGVMLPYTPLHHLLLDFQSPVPTLHTPVLVMTSANFSNEPIVKDNNEAREQLSTLADAFLMHNREIYGRCDDSVVRVIPNPLSVINRPTTDNGLLITDNLLPVRRSRGYAPFPVKLPAAVPPTLAVGGELKSTFCLAKGDYGYMSQHIGDMENLETLDAFATAVSHYKAIFRTEPEKLVCDLHPGYLSTRWAHEQTDVPVVAVQHHHAHVASLLAEHRLDGRTPIIGFSFDGTGYGTDGAVWGGELLLADYAGFERAAHLKYVPLAGGDVAVKRPYRLALAHLHAAGLPWDDALPCVAACPGAERHILQQQLAKNLNSVPTSSMGRLFDAVAALIGVRQEVTYEGQAAIELEAIAAPGVEASYQFELANSCFDAAPIFADIVVDLRAGVATAVIAAKFHNAVANLILQLSLQMRQRHGFNQVALSGGVFQNVMLLETAVRHLHHHNFEIFTHRLVPSNDGGLALGQIMIASKQQ